MPVRIVLNSKGINELLHSPGVQADLKARAQRVADTAGDGMEVTEAGDRNRARYVVITTTPEAMTNEAIDRSLTRAIDAARG